MPVSWTPRSQTIREQIEEELSQADARRQAARQALPPLETPAITTAPEELPAGVLPPARTPSWLPSISPEPELFDIEEPDMPRAAAALFGLPAIGQPPGWMSTSQPGRVVEAAKWWEQPKVLAEKASQAVGSAISKTPVLPEVLKFVAPAFEFIHEKLEKPFAAIITAPLSPALPWQGGESWLEHQKREYDTWEAPTYVKGVAEFAMPLWWMPWFTWGKGISALGKGEKLSRALKVGQLLELPTKEVLNASYKQDWFRSLAHWAENKPVIGGVIKAVGGEAAFARNVGEVFPAMDIATRRLVVVNKEGVRVPVTDVVRREIVNRAVLEDMKHGYRGLQLPRLQALAPRGDVPSVLQVDDFGRVLTATPKAGNKLGQGLSEVFEHPDLYTYGTKEAEAIVREGNKILKEITELAGKEGIVIKQPAFHRLVEGKEVVVGDKTVYEASEFGSRFERARHYLTMEEGIQAGVRYGRDPVKSIAASIDHYFRRIGEQRFNDEISKLGLTIPEMVSLIEPQLVENIASLGTKIGSASYLIKTLKTLKTYRGDSIPSAVRSKIRRGMPEAIERIEQAFSLAPKEASRLMTSLARTIGQETKINARSLKIMLGQFNRRPGRILASEIEDLVKSLNVTNATANKAIRQAYRLVYQSRKEVVKELLGTVRKEADELLSASKGELRPLKKQYRDLAFPFKEGTGQIFGGLAKFRMHPALRNRIFDADIVKMVEATDGRAGGQWMRRMAQGSALGRLAIAALDFSAPFIQGLSVLGRNPAAWAKAVGQQFRFFVEPDDFFKYLMQPEARALAQERWLHGGSRAGFEFFEALAPIQRAAERVPQVGAVLKRGIQETYGRAEVAFSGFGEASRNYMWQALRVKALLPDGTLNTAIARELARSIDRMTGVMSMEALGIPRSQIDFESAWVFFAPRYTRASLSYVADIMKGGLAGAEARKGLGALMAAGMTYYYGIATALGQQPNLDINHPQFMTIKVGNDYVGVGGMLYGLARLGANVVGTALKEPVDFLSLSRFDNPFIKFMFSRSSPLTGLAMGAVLEHKNFFGEPLENVGDWAKFMAEKALPIALQQPILEPEHRNPAVIISQLAGLRTFPKSAWELQEETKDKLAQLEYGLAYDNLDLLQKRRIDQEPEVTRFQEEIDKQTTARGKALSVAYLEKRRDLESARFLHKEAIENLQRAFDAGLITGYEFKEGVIRANYGYGATYEHINQNPRYAEILAKQAEPREVNREYRWELAYDELINASSGNVFEDEFGIFDFQKYEQFLDNLRTKYGDSDISRALEFQREKYAEYPPLFQEWLQAKEILRPYWQVSDEVVRLFGAWYAESSRGQALITKIRKNMRLGNLELDRLYQLFYNQ